MRKKYLILFLIFLILVINSFTYAFSPSDDVIYKGIDVSEWQGKINFNKVKSSGIDIVYIRASEGSSYIDSYFKDNYIHAKKSGLKVGFYHFLTATNTKEAKKEAKFFVNVIKDTNPDCKLAMDFEVFNNLNNDEINKIAEEFLKEVEKLTGKECIIYSDAYNAQYTFSEKLAKKYAIWVADYFVNEPTNNGKWSSWVGFQYTDQGDISGINGYVDQDKFTSGVLLNDISKIQSDDNIKEVTQNIIVKKGDTLSKIGEKYNASCADLAKINNIKNPNLIYEGQQLKVVKNKDNKLYDTSHILYIVKKGDTLTKIAKEYKIGVEKIVKLNKISNPNMIYIGEVLRIPK